MQEYLKNQDLTGNLAKNPIIIKGSQFMYVKAKGLYLPYVQGEKTNLSGACLDEANLVGAEFKDVRNLNRADLERAFLLETEVTEKENYRRGIEKKKVIYC